MNKSFVTLLGFFWLSSVSALDYNQLFSLDVCTCDTATKWMSRVESLYDTFDRSDSYKHLNYSRTLYTFSLYFCNVENPLPKEQVDAFLNNWNTRVVTQSVKFTDIDYSFILPSFTRMKMVPSDFIMSHVSTVNLTNLEDYKLFLTLKAYATIVDTSRYDVPTSLLRFFEEKSKIFQYTQQDMETICIAYKKAGYIPCRNFVDHARLLGVSDDLLHFTKKSSYRLDRVDGMVVKQRDGKRIVETPIWNNFDHFSEIFKKLLITDALDKNFQEIIKFYDEGFYRLFFVAGVELLSTLLSSPLFTKLDHQKQSDFLRAYSHHIKILPSSYYQMSEDENIDAYRSTKWYESYSPQNVIERFLALEKSEAVDAFLRDILISPLEVIARKF